MGLTEDKYLYREACEVRHQVVMNCKELVIRGLRIAGGMYITIKST